MALEKRSVIETHVNGCQVTLYFVSESVESVLEDVKAILSNAYDERVQKEIMELISRVSV